MKVKGQLLNGIAHRSNGLLILLQYWFETVLLPDPGK